MKRLRTKSFQIFKSELKNYKQIAVDVLFKAYPMVSLSCRSTSQRHGSADTDPDQHKNVMDPQHWLADFLCPLYTIKFNLLAKHTAVKLEFYSKNLM